MSTTAVTASVFSGTQGRSYLVTATDDSWNRLLTETGSAQLGFGQTGLLVTHIQTTYAAAGLCAYRVRNSVSQVTKRVGFAYLVGATGPPPYSGGINPFTVEQDDVLEVFTQVA
jgi:hypothetical protein